MSPRPADPPLDREWTQEELRSYLEPHGFTFREGEVIPQGCKYISFQPVTEKEIRWVEDLARRFDWAKRFGW
ncbi:MAG TPA: hypothetical protein VE030_11095 [Burkholderiales bacterium]|nr:hypothetical protein [Burkholderiales bacterium]